LEIGAKGRLARINKAMDKLKGVEPTISFEFPPHCAISALPRSWNWIWRSRMGICGRIARAC